MGKSVEILNIERYDDGWPSRNLVEFVKWATNVLDQVPDEYKDTATIDIESRSGYENDHLPAIEISYSRPLTDVELAAARLRERQRLALEEAEARAAYARLKARFGS